MGDFVPEVFVAALPPLNSEKITPINLRDELKQSYLDYAMSVIVGRALPDVRDGLKPVHRRILFSMSENNLTADRKHRKSATVVGDVLGKYHPHGDSSVYDAMVRLAQGFASRYPLVDGHGNFGSVDGDPAAAYRYTEARMSRLAGELMADIDSDTVDFVPNFDGTTEEPTVLPARYPNLLVNGSTGIAVGMATNIPPHNLREVIDGTIALIDDPELSASELIQYVKGPDFPGGGTIMGTRGIVDAYTTGRGSVTVRANTEIEMGRNGRAAIVINELPYMVGLDPLFEKIADLVKDKKLEGISDLRNESDRQGMRGVIELKRDAVPQVVLNNLYRHTAMQQNFSIIFLALDHNRPRVMDLRDMLQAYIDHRIEVVTRRTRFDLNKAQAREHIVLGLLKAQEHLDEVVKIIRASDSTESARQALMARFDLSEAQCNAILDMQLRRLTGLERAKLEAERAELAARIASLQAILADHTKLLAVIKNELAAVRDKYGDERRTQIEHSAGDLSTEDLIPDEPMAIFITDQGYVKRLNLDTFAKQRRGGRGIGGMQTRENDFVRHFFVSSTHQDVLFFSDRGIVYRLKVHELPEASRQAKGTNIVNLLQLGGEERVTAVIPVQSFDEGKFLVMLTKQGVIKKTELSAFSNIRRNGLIAVALDDGDSLGWVRMTDGGQSIIIGTLEGMAIHFPEDELRPLGRTARGVKAISLRPEDRVVGMDICSPGADVLVVTTDGFGKRTAIEEYRLQNRGGLGLINVKLNVNRQGKVAAILVVTEAEEVVIVTTNGVVIRQAVGEVRQTGRSAQGTRLQRLGEDERVAGVAPVVVTDDEGDADAGETMGDSPGASATE
ncbi:MAG: DNA gyrase subunit A [Candidatus Sericytochromatia bacterium]|nr:DNA gyrase subunit A [Candidatus Sericytochromatia bacterium]